MELRLLARNGENLLVTLGIPVALLALFTLVDVLPTGTAAPLAFLLPRALTVAVMGSALVSLAIATGFERDYLVLKRLGATPLSRRDLVAAKGLAVAATVAVQALVLGTVAGLLSRAQPAAGSLQAPGAAGLAWAALALALGAAAFAGLGLLLAGTLRATLTLALANALFVALVLVSGLLFPTALLPGPLAAATGLLPSTALAGLLDAALGGGSPPARPLLVLLGWAAAAPALAAWRFRWD